jgi:hypothetical protein
MCDESDEIREKMLKGIFRRGREVQRRIGE